jgi:hypothetical protein
MKKTMAALSILLMGLVFSPALWAAEEGEQPDVEYGGRATPEESVNYHHNGTLYRVNIHHRRPARGIAETPESRRQKGFLENISTTVYSNFRSRYVYEGLANSQGFVWQPAATIEAYGVGFNVWGNFVLNDEPDQGRMNEVDLTIYYDTKIGDLTIHPYVMFCFFPTDNEKSLDYSAYTDIKPALHLAYSLGAIDIVTELIFYAHPTAGALLWDFGLGFQHQLVDKLGIETTALFGLGNSRFNRNAFGSPQTRINRFEYSLSLPWNPWRGLVIEPNVHVSTLLPKRFRDAVQTPVLVWGGVDFTYHF